MDRTFPGSNSNSDYLIENSGASIFKVNFVGSSESQVSINFLVYFKITPVPFHS
jgi:hypothetical protein